MRNLFLLFFVLFTTSQLIAQNTVTIKGQVSDSTSLTGIPYSTVSLTKTTDSTFIKKNASDLNGKFLLTVNSEGEYVLNIQSQGYAVVNKSFIIEKEQKEIDLGIITVKESANQLNAVEISVTKPLVKVEADKLTYNAESDPESKILSALDLLRKVPLVSVDADDNVKIKGSGKFKIHLNGRPSAMANNNPKEFLRNLQASTIKNIEVITSPGAKYDAEGIGGIINIITKTKIANGYTGSVNAGANNVGRYRSGLYFATTIGKFGFSTNITGMQQTGNKNHSLSNRINYLNPEMNYSNRTGSSTYKGINSWGSGEISYEIDSLNLISGSFDFYYSDYSSDATATTEILNSENALSQSFLQNSTEQNMFSGPSGNINYQHIFKNNKERILTFSYLYNSSPQNGESTAETSNILNYISNKQKSDNKARSEEHTIQADYVQPFTNEMKLESGVKYIYRLNKSNTNYLIFNPETNEYIANVDLQNDFNQTQNIQAFYATFSKTFKKLSLKTGARIENSVLEGKFESKPDNNFTNKNIEIVPSGTVSYNLTETQSISLAYSMRIQRPDIWYLNPYIDNSDPQNIRQGNPNLDPERFHNIDLAFNFMKPKLTMNLSISESYSKNGIDEYVTIDVNNVLSTTYQNINNISSTSVSLYGNLQITKKLSFNTNISTNYNKVKSNSTVNISSKGLGGYGEGSFQFTIAKGFKTSVNAWYYSQAPTLQNKMKPFYSYGYTISKEFLDNKLTLSINIRDLFRKESCWSNETFNKDFYQKTQYFNPGRNFGFNLSYRFGEMSKQLKKAQRGIENDDKKGGGKIGGGQ